MQNSPPSSSTTTVYTILTITTLLFLLLFFSSFPTTPPPPSFSDPYLFPHRPSTAQYHNHQLLFTTTNKTTNQSPPSIAYFISGSSNDSGRIIRLLFSIYHPRNQYLLHLDSSAPQKERDFLALTVQSVKVMWSAQNVNVIGKSDLVSPKGSSSVSSTLHGAAILLKLCSDWDWFINLSAADYPLVTQDGSSAFTVGQAALKAASGKVIKHEKACLDNQHVFIPFAFDTFGFLAPKAVDLLSRVQRVMHSNVMTPRSMDVVFKRLSFANRKIH
ncbi:putative glycosyl transferase, family 14, beta-glucuronosyltransferase GlcAT14A/B/C [Helianthus annuus]|nr:putative glycosyl transferase, family 14, beta-glucuronosyltransferase GlcAT14A/B/C [Helianthus annuus]